MFKKLLQSSIIVSFFTLISRVLGLIRDIVIANLIGAGMSSDVFILANKIPNFLRRLFAEGSFSQAFIPVLSEYKEKKPDEVQLLISSVLGTLGGIITATTLIGMICSPIIMAIFANGWFVDYIQNDGTKFTIASSLLKITFPYLWFISFVAFSAAVLNTFGKFSIGAISPVFLNISMIAFGIYICPKLESPEFGLAASIFVGGLLQFLFQIPFLYKKNLLVKPKWNWHYEGVKKIKNLMLPGIFSLSVSQINLMIDSIIASYLVTGSISWLYYSDRILEFPIGLFSIAIVVVLSPQLSKQFARKETAEYTKTIDWGVKTIFAVGIPSMFGILILVKPIIITVFMHGKFNAADMNMTANSLIAYIMGLIAIMLGKVFSSGFSCMQNTKTPAKYAVIAVCINIIFNVILSIKLGHVGLAAATSIAATANMVLLYSKLNKLKVYKITADTLWFTTKVLIAAAIMGILIYFYKPTTENWIEMQKTKQVYKLIELVVIGGVSYLTTFGILKCHRNIMER